jgi:methionyl aminopeptidase
MIIIKTPAEIDAMRVVNQMTGRVRTAVAEAVRPGMTTLELGNLAKRLIKAEGGVSAFYGYQGFPGQICTSVNDEVVHGIPNKRRLKEGDIVSIDCGISYGGFIGDTAVTVAVGEVDGETQRLLDVTEASLFAGIAKAVEGNRLGDVSHAIQTVVEEAGLTIVRDFVGHGIGREMHEDPQIPNFGKPGRGPVLKAGMTLAIEPMVNIGTAKVTVLEDDWTVVTQDNRFSAHFEHTIAVGKTEAEILTLV